MEEQIKALKDYIYPDGVYNAKRANSLFIKSKFPDIYNKIKENYKQNLYMLIHEVAVIPTCAHNGCNNIVKFNSIATGFRKFCSNKCLNESLKNNVNFKEKVSLGRKTDVYETRYNYKGAYKQNNYIHLPNYCKHGDVKFYDNENINKLYNSGAIMCEKCLDEYINDNTPVDIQLNRDALECIYDDIKYKINDKWFKINHTEIYKAIVQYTSHIEDAELSERVYMFLSDIKERPKCICCGDYTHWNASSMRYTYVCDKTACSHTTSKGEEEVRDYIKSLGVETDKKKIGIYNYDIVCGNYIFEYNGLYWHSDNILSDKLYHSKKQSEANLNGYELIYIWEDDWELKQDIVKSIIASKLNKTSRIYARCTHIQEIPVSEANEFIFKNHIQGSCVAKIAYGLFNNSELVSVMTFGKCRMITNSLEQGYELIRFCNKLNTTVVGGASKLFKAFLSHYKGDLISYANKDISNGKMYEKLGFTYVGDTALSYCWAKKTRIHRSNFMKHKLVKQGYDKALTEDEIMRGGGYYKIWLSGSKKYVYKKGE